MATSKVRLKEPNPRLAAPKSKPEKGKKRSAREKDEEDPKPEDVPEETEEEIQRKQMARSMISLRNVASAVEKDLENFLVAYVAKEDFSAKAFYELWHEKNFPALFSNIDSFRRVKNFTEVLFSLTRNFLLPPNDFRARTGAIYLMFAFFQIQPLVRLCHYTLTLDHVEEMKPHLEWLMDNRIEDPLIVYSTMIRLGAIHFSFEHVPRIPEKWRMYGLLDRPEDRAKYEEEEKEAVKEMDAKKVVYQQALANIERLKKEYSQALKALEAKIGPENARSILNFGTDPLVLGIDDSEGASARKSLRELAAPGVSGSGSSGSGRQPDRPSTSGTQGPGRTESESILDRRKSIRDRAFAFPAQPPPGSSIKHKY